MQIDKEISETIWAALCTEQDYIGNKLAEADLDDNTRLSYVKDWRAIKKAMRWFIVNRDALKSI